MARGLAAVVDPRRLTVIVNVGDDEEFYGLHVSADLDTVLYTLAGIEGPHGWGIADDTFETMERLATLGLDTRFRLGDRDLAASMFRTSRLRDGEALSEITRRLAEAMGVGCRLLPATDDRVRTQIVTGDGELLSFQEYFVLRGHRDRVAEVRYAGSAEAAPAPGVIHALDTADLVVIAPSNPPLSIWPILSIPGIRESLAAARVVAVSPLFGGRALKGPADRVMSALGLPPGNAGVAAAYAPLVDVLVVDRGDAGDVPLLADGDLEVIAADTRIGDPEAAARFAEWILDEAVR